MDGFTYTNIFDTKGIEYLIIIGFLALLIPFWIVLNRQTGVTRMVQHAVNVLSANLLRIPQGLFYSRNHTWAFLEKSGLARIGIDDFLLQVVGPVKISNLRTQGQTIRKGELLAEIKQDGKQLSIYSPVSGEIVNTNSMVSDQPEILSQDPYEEGWIYAVRPSNWKEETNSFLLAEEASKWIGREVDRFKDFLAVSLGKHSADPSLVAFQEGGEIRANILSEMDMNIWKDFQESFLD